MGTSLTFTQALEQAELLARQALPKELHERLSAAYALVKDGRVFQHTDGSWQVDSTSREGLTYTVNGTCPCDDTHYNKPLRGLCKHRLSVYLSRKALALMHAPQEDAGSLPDTIAQAAVTLLPYDKSESSQEPVTANVTGVTHPPALPEAPASVNCHITIAGRQCQLTLRDSDETRLLARLQRVLESFPLPQELPQAAPQQGWCQIHHTLMHQTTKHGKSWYSHKLSDGTWCQGRVRQ